MTDELQRFSETLFGAVFGRMLIREGVTTEKNPIGYSNDPHDPGGETVFGIARNKHPNCAVFTVLDMECRLACTVGRKFDPKMAPARAIERMRERAADFYFGEFWRRTGAHMWGEMFPTLAELLFDCAVNQGSELQVRFLQTGINTLNRGYRAETGGESLFPNLRPDGRFGMKTNGALGTLVAHDGLLPTEERLIKLCVGQQIARYIQLCERDEKFERYIRGWLDHRIHVELPQFGE